MPFRSFDMLAFLYVIFSSITPSPPKTVHIIIIERIGLKLAKNQNPEIELNEYGERIAPKQTKKQADSAQTKPAPKNTARKPAPKKRTVKNDTPKAETPKQNTRKQDLKKSDIKKSDAKKSDGLFKKSAPKKPAQKQTKPKADKKNLPEIHPETGMPLHLTNHRAVKKTPLKIIPLGGLNEIGKNMTVFECANDIFIVDCGLAFPDSDMPGVDIVLPDFSYVEQNAEKIRGIVITHGHEDHIGGLAYLLKKVNVPVYATRLTIGLIEGKLREHGILSSAKLNVVTPRQTVKMGCMAVEFIRVNHSIPDAVGLAVHTPV